MLTPRIKALHAIEIGVQNLSEAVKFYSEVWGLEQSYLGEGRAHFRAANELTNVLIVHEQKKPGLINLKFSAADKYAVDCLQAVARAFGLDVPDPFTKGIGANEEYGFCFRCPDGHNISIVTSCREWRAGVIDSSKPTKLSPVVLNTADIDRQAAFFKDLLGFRLSDKTDVMEFLRCGADHHSVAVATGSRPSVNHISFEMDNFDGLMRAVGRLKAHGFNLEWGVGRHGPGNNIFAYFIDPSGFVVEYTTEMEIVDESCYLAKDAVYWRAFPMRPCRWGVATHLSKRIIDAFDGRLLIETEHNGQQ